LTYIPTLLGRIKQLFLSLFQPYLKSLVDSLDAGTVALTEAASSALQQFKARLLEEKWNKIFDRCLRGCEEKDSVGYEIPFSAELG